MWETELLMYASWLIWNIFCIYFQWRCPYWARQRILPLTSESMSEAQWKSMQGLIPNCNTMWLVIHILRWRKENIPICLTLLLLLLPKQANSQSLKNFPDLINLAESKPVRTFPTSSTCGDQSRSAFCKSSIFRSSVTDACIQDYCDQSCPTRTVLPSSVDLLLRATGYGSCVSIDTINTRPGSREYSVRFTTGRQCYLSPQSRPDLGASGAFTLTFWVWLETTEIG